MECSRPPPVSFAGISQQPHEDGWPASLSGGPSPGASVSGDGGNSRFPYPIGRATKTQNFHSKSHLCGVIRGPDLVSQVRPLSFVPRTSKPAEGSGRPAGNGREYKVPWPVVSVLCTHVCLAGMMGLRQEVVPTLQQHHYRTHSLLGKNQIRLTFDPDRRCGKKSPGRTPWTHSLVPHLQPGNSPQHFLRLLVLDTRKGTISLSPSNPPIDRDPAQFVFSASYARQPTLTCCSRPATHHRDVTDKPDRHEASIPRSLTRRWHLLASRSMDC